MNANYTYRELIGLTKILKIVLGLGAAIAVVSLLSSFMQLELLSRGTFSDAEGQANDSREQIIGLVNFALYVVTLVIFGRWIVRANRNVRALGADGLRMTPGWAVGYFFVPIMHLWRPYQAMKDLWKASHNPASWNGTTAGSILPVWWTFWLLSNIIGQISFRIMMSAQELEDFQAATYIQIVAETVDISLCLVAIILVSQIARAQSNHSDTSV
jgi:hypothetical protein